MCKNKQELKNKMKFIIIAIQFSLLLLFFHIFFDFKVTSFNDRIMGNGNLCGIDITNRINSLYLIVFILIPIVTICIYKILKKILNDVNSRTIKCLNLIAILGIINTILLFANKLQEFNTLTLSVFVLLGINLFIIVSVLISKIRNKKFEFKNVKWSLIAAVPMAFFATLILHKLQIKIIDEQINWFVCYIIAVTTLNILINFKKINKELLEKAYTCFMLAPLFEMVYLELYNILNQYNIFLQHKIRTIVLIYIICFTVSVIVYLVNRKKKTVYKYTKYYYPIILIIFSLIIAALPMTTIVNTDLFETSNHGSSVYELLRYGKIPIIENFDAHMFNNEFFGIIYGIFNNDITGAIFCIYNSYRYVFLCLVLYYFIKKIFSRDTAFLLISFMPLFYDYGLNMYYMALIAIIALINVYKTQKIKDYLFYWISLVFLCIWQLDIGFSAGIATVLTLIILWFKDRKNINIKNAIISFFSVIGVCAVMYLGICIIKSINPVTRAIEFLKIAMSNINWAYSTMGDTSMLAYTFCYYIMPLIVVSTLIYIIFKINNKNDKRINNINVILIALGIFYISNLQRGIVRHSLVERNIGLILNISWLYLSIFIMKYNKKDVKFFCVIYTTIIIINNLLLIPTLNESTNIFEMGVNKYLTFKIHDENYQQKQERVIISNEMKNEYTNLKEVLNVLLDENETFGDFSNQTLLYALLDKEKPVYVNQSPGLLSGETTQQLFINEIENYSKNVSIIIKAKEKLLSDSLDGIMNQYRYYLVSEYINKNYEPIALVNGYEIWTKKEKYNENLEKLQGINNDKLTVLTTEQYIKQNENIIYLSKIPRIWGEYDNNKNKQNLLMQLSNNLYIENEKSIEIQSNNLNKDNGNYLRLNIDSKEDTSLSIELYEDKEIRGEYYFDIEEGNHDYIVRISTIYEWYKANINQFKIKVEKPLTINNISILEADTLKSYR